MATVSPSADQTADILKNISLDPQTKTTEITEPTKKPSVDSGNGLVQPSNRSASPLIPDYMDPTLGYYSNGYPYYYGGYDGTTVDWEDYSRYLNSEGVDLANSVYGYGYAPYGAFSPAGSPVPTVGQDGQLYGSQYQYPSPYFQPMAPTGGPYVAGTTPAKGVTTLPAAVDDSALTDDSTKGKTNGVGPKGTTGAAPKGTTGAAPVKTTPFQIPAFNANGSYGRGAQNGYYDPRYGVDGVQSPIPWLDTPYFNPQTKNNASNSLKNQNNSSHLMGSRPITGMNTSCGYMNRMYPNKLYGQYGNNYRSGYGYGYGSTAYDFQSNRGWYPVDNKYKQRGRGNSFFGYNNENGDELNELNRGPRARTGQDRKPFTPVSIAVKGQSLDLAPTENIEKEVKEEVKEVKDVSLTPDREQYNKPDFADTYENAKFFIIKSYSEDDVHKSIKYNVWASTQNGNKKLDAAYQEAQQKSEKCPIFLFFSVNTSGQFVGVAEMIGPVDFEKSLEYWQQDKWIGCFPVKWHIVKDLPNNLLKHIILENNENKPVTNSRDTQEVRLEQGLQVIKIFKEHSSKQCILDDFDFYEDRQKKIQEKKAKLQFQKQAWEGKHVNDEKTKGTPADVADLVKLADNVQVDVADVAKPAVEKKVVVNGVANGC